MRKLRILLAAGLAVLLVQSTEAVAELTSSVAVQALYDDNIYRMESGSVDSWVTLIRPDAQLVIAQGASSYTLEAGAESGLYKSRSQIGSDDYTDYHLTGKAELELNVRNHLVMDLTHAYGHDPRGVARTDQPTKDFNSLAYVTANDIAEPDEWQKEGVVVKYGYGADNAFGRLSLSGHYRSTEYQNHTPVTDLLNYDVAEVRAAAFLQLLPRTSFLLEARSIKLNYDKPDPGPPATSRDSSEMKYFVGAEWQPTAKTEGSVRFGYQQRDPDESTYKHFSSTAWEADVIWRPKTYSSLRFNSYRSVLPSTNGLSYVDIQLYAVNWKHAWNKDFNTVLYVQNESQNYQSITKRDDIIDSFGLIANYAVTEVVTLSTSYKYEDRRSSVANTDFVRNIISVGAEAVFR